MQWSDDTRVGPIIFEEVFEDCEEVRYKKAPDRKPGNFNSIKGGKIRFKF